MIEDIVEFTELGAFVYRPVKTYSSGMSSRLAFGIATAVDPEILIIDEVLGTGDAYFASKAYRRMIDFCNRGKALLFVSHAPDAILRLCDRAIWLQNGNIRLEGPAEHIVAQYEIDSRRAEDESSRQQTAIERENWHNAAERLDLPTEETAKLRIVPSHGGSFVETHYLNEIAIEGLGAVPVRVPLEIVDPGSRDVAAWPELLTSEWGRLYERQGVQCRAVSRSFGRSPGAHFTVRRPSELSGTASTPLQIVLRSMSETGAEDLVVEYLDVNDGRWRRLAVEQRSDNGGWQQSVFAGKIGFPSSRQIVNIRQMIEERHQPPVELVEVFAESGGERTVVITEDAAFSVGVRLRFNQSLPMVDVGVKFTRVDGIYCFWMSSGMANGNLIRPEGERVVMFHFDENVFGAGAYNLTIQVSNGWQYPDNYPYGQVYLREVNAIKLMIKPRLAGLDMGIVNKLARVSVDDPVA
jgi:lipopolysaccharide transport system ATP-binding protein